MICSKCGSNEPDSGLYCTKCGAKLEAEAPAIPFEPVAPADPNASPFAAQGSGAAYSQAPSGGADCAQPAAQGGSPYAGGYSAPAPGSSPYTGAAYGGAPRSGSSNDDWKGITALVCGIASLPCCFTCWGGLLLGIAGIVFGILGLKTSKSSFAIAGIVCGAVGALLGVFMLIMSIGVVSAYDMSGGLEEFIENVPGTFYF